MITNQFIIQTLNYIYMLVTYILNFVKKYFTRRLKTFERITPSKSVVYVSVIREKVSRTYTGMYLTFTGFVQESAGVSGNAVISFTSSH